MINNDEYRPFHEPWHAQIFALTIHLNEQGHFEWKDWSQAFREALFFGKFQWCNSRGRRLLLGLVEDY